jgi:hypothetical protein|nr:MAG TPA: endonuclease subunit [Caudoviricetes sp.]
MEDKNNSDNIYYIITDTHFGSHQNSKSWLDDNLGFFYQQFIPQIKKQKLENPTQQFHLIHCGDVFDVRYSINLEIGTRVKQLFKDLLEPSLFDQITIIGGNHDYYQNYTNDNCSIDLILGELTESLEYKNKIKLITQTIEIDEENNFIFIPWILDDPAGNTMEYTINILKDYFEYILKENNSNKSINIFCHLDIFGQFDVNHNHIEPILNIIQKYSGLDSIDQINIFSGHIHGPFKTFKPSNSKKYYSDKVNMINLGSTIYLNFSDTDDHHYYSASFDSPNGHLNLTKYLNEYSIRFHNINQTGKFKEFLEIIKKGKENKDKEKEDGNKIIKPKDFIRLYIRPEELKDHLKKIREIKSTYKELEILPFFDIPNPGLNNNPNGNNNNLNNPNNIGFDINNLINYLPEHLKEIYKSLI